MIYSYFIKVLKEELFCISYGNIFQSLIVINNALYNFARAYISGMEL